MSTDQIAALLEKGAEAGCLEISELNEVVEALELGDEEIEHLYEQLEEQHIDVRDDCGREKSESTYINGERVRGEGLLKHGDEITLGTTRARFDDGSGRAMGPAQQNAPPPSENLVGRSLEDLLNMPVASVEGAARHEQPSTAAPASLR